MPGWTEAISYRTIPLQCILLPPPLACVLWSWRDLCLVRSAWLFFPAFFGCLLALFDTESLSTTLFRRHDLLYHVKKIYDRQKFIKYISHIYCYRRFRSCSEWNTTIADIQQIIARHLIVRHLCSSYFSIARRYVTGRCSDFTFWTLFAWERETELPIYAVIRHSHPPRGRYSYIGE